MSEHDVTLAAWREQVRLLGDCPWPGPRPLTPADLATGGHLLIGREEDRKRLGRDIHGTPLTVFRADSGTGKSSLLAALAGDLGDAELRVLTVSRWEAQSGRADADAFLRTQVADQLPPEVVAQRDRPLIDVLDERYGGRCVLILDQFEELIRYRAGLHAEVRQWVVDAILRHRIKVVLSLRSEYAHRLRPLERAIRSRGMTTYDLDAIVDPERVREVCVGGPRELLAHRFATTDVVDEVVAAWERAQHDDLVPDRIGLLHLQAVLYSLHQRARGGPIAIAHLDELSGTTDRSTLEPGELFTAGLRHAFKTKLEHCEVACRDDDPAWAERGGPAPSWRIDRPLVVGARDAVPRLVGHLSSGGYKLSREVSELMRQAMDRELRVLDRAFANGSAADDRAVALTLRLMPSTEGADAADPLSTPHDELVALLRGSSDQAVPDEAPSWLSVLEQTLGEDREVSAGVVLGSPPEDVLVEELRRFAFAVAWLDAADLVRLTPLGDGETMLSLIHDGFSAALEHWAAGVQSSPAAALALLTAAVGEAFDWKGGDDRGRPWPQLGGADHPQVHANVRWRSCRVTADLTRVVFVNCDFRQTLFADCRFEGVVFVNCLLDGATFSGCTIVGASSPGREDPGNPQREEAPIFTVACDPEEAATFVRYGRVTDPAPHLLSATSGVPALPLRGPAATHAWHQEAGGLTMYGGRLCALMVRDCTFVAEGTLALRFVSGSSLDIVEQRHGHVDLYLSAIRGVSVTAPVGGDRDGSDESTLSITATDSILADTWIGPGLVGAVDIQSCRVWNLFNGAGRIGDQGPGVRVHLADTQYTGLIDVEEPADLGPIPGMGHRGLGDQPGHAALVVTKAEEMAYRSDPGAYRIRQLREQLRP